MPQVHIALQEVQAIALMLYRMAFLLSGKVVSFHLDNSTAKTHLCNHGGRTSVFLSRPACHILNLANKHAVNLIPACVPTNLSVEADYLSWEGWFWSNLFFLT